MNTKDIHVSVAQIGSRMHYAVPRTLQEAGLLKYLFVDVCASKGLGKALGNLPHQLLPGGLRRLAGRTIDDVPTEKIFTEDLIGLKKAFFYRRRSKYEDFAAINLLHVSEWCRAVAKNRADDSTHLYAFNSCALEIFAGNNWRDTKKVLEQTIAPLRVERDILLEGQSRFSDYDWKVESAPLDSYQKSCEREEEEWALADKIVCGSDFVKAAMGRLNGPVHKCDVIPYGVGTAAQAPPARALKERGQKLNVLFVGAVGLRKGAPILAEVARRCQGIANFRVVGQMDAPPMFEKKLREHCEVLGVVPRQQMQSQYSWSDVFLLPSLCEGSATVTYEAASFGVPVICSENSGSTVRHDVSGYVYPAFETDKIVERLFMLHAEPEHLQRLSAGALLTALDQTEAQYGKRLLAAFQ